MDGSQAPPTDTVRLKRHRFTATDVRKMIEAGILPDKAPLELIDGELIEMPSEGEPHWDAKTAIVNWVLRRLPETVMLAPDGPLRLSEDDEPEPDFFLYPAALRVNRVRGPDTLLVVEISDSSLRKDRIVKAPLYAAYGVAAYWIVDLEHRITQRFSLADGVYGEPEQTPFDGDLHVPGIAETLVLAAVL